MSRSRGVALGRLLLTPWNIDVLPMGTAQASGLLATTGWSWALFARRK